MAASNRPSRSPGFRTVLEALNCEVATPDEARDILGLKGGNNVNF